MSASDRMFVLLIGLFASIFTFSVSVIILSSNAPVLKRIPRTKHYQVYEFPQDYLESNECKTITITKSEDSNKKLMCPNPGHYLKILDENKILCDCNGREVRIYGI